MAEYVGLDVSMKEMAVSIRRDGDPIKASKISPSVARPTTHSTVLRRLASVSLSIVGDIERASRLMVQAARALVAPIVPAAAGGDGMTFCRTAMDEAECIAFEGPTPTSSLD